MKLIASILKNMGMNGGKPRLWLQGRMPERAGFLPGVTYSIEKREDRSAVVLRLADDGNYVVSKKKGKVGDDALIDLNSQRVLGMFQGAKSVRVLIGANEIWILPDAFDLKKRERVERFERELASGEVTAGALAHGIGVMTNALHEGMESAGLRTKLRFAVEIEEDSLDVASQNNPSWDDDTVAVAMPIQQLAFGDQYTLSRLPKVSFLDMGLPCTAASVAGRAKKHLAKPEDDEKAGHLVAAAVALVAHFNPFSWTCENVSPWFNTASASLFRTQMKELGYDIHELVLLGEEYALEARERTVWVGVTEGVQLDLTTVVPPPRLVETLGQVMEDVADDSPLWKTMDYLKEKEVRDAAQGKGFRMSLGDASTTRIGTVGRGYSKCRSTEIKIKHPRDPNLLRQLTPLEHAAIKGIPQHLFAEQTSVTRIHEWLGQSVIWPAFRHLGEVIGAALGKGVVKAVVVRQSDGDDVEAADLFAAVA